MKLNNAPAYAIDDTQPDLKRVKVVIHNTGHHMRVLSESTYNRPIDAVVRETIANAMDASKGKAFDITAPSMLDPNFRVRDYGVGMDEEFFTTGYAAVGFSTKRDSNDEVGGFGQGRFAAFAYKACDAFFVRGIKNKKWFLGQVSRDHDFEIFVSVVSRGDSVEADGVEVFVPVEVKDHAEFKKSIQTYTEFLDPKPTTDVDFVTRPGVMEGADKSWKIISFEGDSNQPHFDMPVRAIMGGIPYKMDLGTVFPHYRSDLFLYVSAVDIHFPIGSLSIPTSREELRYDDATKKVITNKFLDMRKEIESLKASIEGTMPTMWEAWTNDKVLAYHKALGTANETKSFQKSAIPDLLTLQTLDKVREVNGRSSVMAPKLSITLKAKYFVYLADEDQWRAKFCHDIVPKVAQTNLGPKIHGYAIVVKSQAAIDTLGNPPFIKISSLPKPPPTPRTTTVLGTGATVKTKRVPILMKVMYDNYSPPTFMADPSLSFSAKDKVYWPVALTRIEEDHQRLFEMIGKSKYGQAAVGVAKPDRKLAAAAGWVQIDEAIKKICAEPLVVLGHSISQHSKMFTSYPFHEKEKIQELWWLMDRGFKLPHGNKSLEDKIRAIAPLYWNKQDVYTHLIAFMQRFMDVKTDPVPGLAMDQEWKDFMKQHLLLDATLGSRFYSEASKNQKADVPTLLAMAKKAL